MLQAWMDGELGQAERVILEQHVAECAFCTATLRRHQRSAAMLFEGLSDFRLKRDLRQSVLEIRPG